MWTPTESASCALCCLVGGQRKEKEGATGRRQGDLVALSPGVNFSASVPAFGETTHHVPPFGSPPFSSPASTAVGHANDWTRIPRYMSTLLGLAPSCRPACISDCSRPTRRRPACCLHAPRPPADDPDGFRAADRRSSTEFPHLSEDGCLSRYRVGLRLPLGSRFTSHLFLPFLGRQQRKDDNQLAPSFQQVPLGSHLPPANTRRDQGENLGQTTSTVPFASPYCQNISSFPSLTKLPAPFAYHSSHHPSKPAAVDGLLPDGSPGAGRESWKSEICHQPCLSTSSAAPKERHNSRQ